MCNAAANDDNSNHRLLMSENVYVLIGRKQPSQVIISHIYTCLCICCSYVQYSLFSYTHRYMFWKEANRSIQDMSSALRLFHSFSLSMFVSLYVWLHERIHSYIKDRTVCNLPVVWATVVCRMVSFTVCAQSYYMTESFGWRWLCAHERTLIHTYESAGSSMSFAIIPLTKETKIGNSIPRETRHTEPNIRANTKR